MLSKPKHGFILFALILLTLVLGCGEDDPTNPEPQVEPQVGTIVIDPNPDTISAPWILTGPDKQEWSGEGYKSLEGLTPGEYTLTWGNVTGWVTPPVFAQRLVAGATLNFAGTYTREKGTIVIDQTPDVLAGSEWSLTGPQTEISSGDLTLTDMPTGEYTITWKSIYGFITPASNSQTLTADQSLSFEGTYIQRGELSFAPWTMVLDDERGQIYVSKRYWSEVAIVSTSNLQVTGTIHFNIFGDARGLALSSDGNTLYVALYGAGAVAAVDLTTHEVTEIDIGAELNDGRTYDVIEAQPDILLVTAYSTGLAYAVKVDRGNEDIASRVASNKVIRGNPTLARDPDGAFAYVGEDFSPNSLYKLDLSQNDYPIILEDDHGEVSGTSRIEVSPDGSRIYLLSGQVLSTETFDQIGSTGIGIPKISLDGSICYVGNWDGAIDIYDTTTFHLVSSVPFPGSVSRLLLSGDGNTMYVLDNDQILGVPLP